MVRTAINVYSVRELDDSVLELIDRVAEAGYDGIQFSGNHTALDGDHEEIATALKETGLEVPPPHVSIEKLEESLDEVRIAYEALGVNEAAVPYLPQSEFQSVDAIDQTTRRLSALHDELDDENWDLHYHYHDHEFGNIDDEVTGFETLTERTDIKIELDVGWAQYAGRDPIELIETYGNRMPLIHMKDLDTDAEPRECFREIGEGDVDMQGCADAARDAGSEWLIYEHDDPEDPLASIDYGAEFLDSL
ncbi:hypothetical protein HALLA_00615 (plasmid) [Halostagnicola larsenii XH-48]|uniref:Xylose isomerase-like TIM barrel domain-containing protein n=2 Tax=Halostagnicola larsenii TaxID=353800 RepID=W0JT72_9EURY|nr:hypothetical protein HALLA_00615 [Halostagnicola larsenii XH-48]